MDVPKFCLYITLLKEKYVDSKIIFNVKINSSLGILQLSKMLSSLFDTLLMAKSKGVLVNNDTTSRESKMCLSFNLTLLSFSLIENYSQCD